jgi:signal transduction histidine kinase
MTVHLARPTGTATIAGEDAGAATLDLLSSIAHELRAPLSSLTASVEMLPLAGDRDRERFTRIIQRQAMRLTGIVEGLLDAYRAGRGELTIVPELLPARDFLEALCEEQAALFPAHRFQIDSNGGEMASDPRLLAIVVGNLLSNAAKYSPAGSTVVARFCADDAGRRIEVEDEGGGVPAELRDRIFERGERGASAIPGHGLGLHIASQLCEAMGAELTLGDALSGRGCRFTVRLSAPKGA